MASDGGAPAASPVPVQPVSTTMRHLTLVAIFFLIGTSPALGDVATADWRPLYERVDAPLQRSLEQRLHANADWSRLVRNRKMAIGLVDLNGGTPRFARVNGNEMMYAASLPKIAILLAAHVSFEDGSLAETDEAHRDLADMIRVSSNSAATRLIDHIGLTRIQAILKDPRYGFYDERRGGGLWVGKRYASAGPRIGDPLHDISHGASVTQVCRFFYLLATDRLVSPDRSRSMLEDLSDPGLHHKFVSQIDRRAPGANVYRKSGTWRNWHSDAVLVQGSRDRNYILVGLVESPDGEKILRDILPAVEDLILPQTLAEDTAAR